MIKSNNYNFKNNSNHATEYSLISEKINSSIDNNIRNGDTKNNKIKKQKKISNLINYLKNEKILFNCVAIFLVYNLYFNFLINLSIFLFL